MSLSTVADDNAVLRLDPSYYRKRDIVRLARLSLQTNERLGTLCYITDGIHTPIDFDAGSGIKVISAKHPKEGYFDLSSVGEIAAESHRENPRTALSAGDVLVSTVGTIGNAAVVDEELLPANSDRHVGIIRPRRGGRRPLSPYYLTAFLLSRYGRLQTRRETTGNVQPNLFLIKIREFRIARYSSQFESRLHNIYARARSAFHEATDRQKEAGYALLTALGFADWQPPVSVSYTASAVDVLNANRLDAQYFMPAKEQVRRSLAALPGRPMAERVRSIRDMFVPHRASASTPVRNYDVTDALQPLLDPDKETSLAGEVGSVKKTLSDGDVVVSRLRAYLREIAVVRTRGDVPSIGSSEFLVLRAKEGQRNITPEALMVFLRSPPVQTILRWCQDGSQHPRFSEGDLLSVPVPNVVAETSGQITAIVKRGFAARHEARRLVELAKRAVEVAVESDESAAIILLDRAESAS